MSTKKARGLFGSTNTFVGQVEMCVPGDHASLAVELAKPVACEVGDRFAIREGGRTIGSGIVTRVAV